MALRWKDQALSDRERIARYIAGEGSPAAARKLDKEFVDKAHTAAQRPKLYRSGRMRGTREVVVRPNYVMVYRIEDDGGVTVLRVLHATQQWPSVVKE
ncbi:hypothetical protein PT7_0243 [Pusillimonas sp. T7-7]|uniref:type II toxin-antitoxin system RelE/ParE family toxin n=1 Tax=Pusillimonas sp. (strain T7-7) TaxID=1007105 RepID=UPI00020849AA|nr:type II toxin-antitoxin system mRNA interferase toxin, RelE/StbE family [Pusillimonas sp. T7-7]AEC18783.1 hypothetical protein PT7_0243 [Pusillimonas sp. T7-7]